MDTETRRLSILESGRDQIVTSGRARRADLASIGDSLLASPLRLPFGAHGGAIDLLATEVDLVDLARVGDVIQRIRVQHDEIGALAGRHRAEVIELQGFRGQAGGGDNYLR